MSLKTAIAAFLIVAGASEGRAQQSPFNGNESLEGCKNHVSTPGKFDYSAGLCIGVMNATYYFGQTRDFCMPPGVTMNQMARVAIAYMERNPQYLHQLLVQLSTRAFAEAWPCKK